MVEAQGRATGHRPKFSGHRSKGKTHLFYDLWWISEINSPRGDSWKQACPALREDVQRSNELSRATPIKVWLPGAHMSSVDS